MFFIVRHCRHDIIQGHNVNFFVYFDTFSKLGSKFPAHYKHSKAIFYTISNKLVCFSTLGTVEIML